MPRSRPARCRILSALTLAILLPVGCGAPNGAPQPTTAVAPASQTPVLSGDREMSAPAPMPRTAALVGRGFAQVAGQPGQTINERRLLAIRAARLDAMRDLTEQVHGIRITSDSQLRDATMRNDYLAAQVQGMMRGARTVSIEPRGEDGYAVELELNQTMVAQLARAAQ